MTRDFNDTFVFVKVVEHGSFTAASKNLGLPKTTVSRRVQQLEQRLGAPLLKRTTRRIGLTEAGTLYFDHSRRMVQEIEAAEAAVNQLHGAPRGWLRVTLPYSLAINGVAPMLPEFFARYPEVRVELVMSNEHLDLVASEIDLALRVGPLVDSSLVARKLCGYSSHVYASTTYLERYGAPLVPEDLRHHRALAMPVHRQGGRFSWHLRNAATERDFAIDPVLVGNDPASLLAPLLAGSGLALMPDGYSDDSVDDAGALVPLMPDWHGPGAELFAVYPAGRAPAPKLRAFVDFVVERLAQIRCVTAEPENPVQLVLAANSPSR